MDQDGVAAAEAEGAVAVETGDDREPPREAEAPRVRQAAAAERRPEPIAEAPKVDVKPVEVPQSPEARPKIDVTETASETPRPRARSTTSGEPKLERVVVGPDAAAEVDAAQGGPTRKGWWQRRLGG